MILKVLSWNIHKGIGGIDRRYQLSRIADVINQVNPDIALLQEVADRWPVAGGDLQGELLAEMTPLCHLAFAPEHRFSQGGYGNAILTRFPIIDLHRIDLKVTWRKQRSALQARIAIPRENDSPLKVVATSLHLGLAESERREQLKRLLTTDGLSARGGPSILGGDFNDVFGTLHGRFSNRYVRAGGRVLTFPAALPVFCLDGIYVSGLDIISGEALCEGVCRKASDHLPLLAELRFNDSNSETTVP